MASCCSTWIKFWALILLALFLLAFGLVTIFLVPQKVKNQIKQSLPLFPVEDSETYDKWVNIPIPIYNKFYFFNISNVDHILNNGSIPILQELGPYVYSEQRQKTNITFSQDGQLVSYNVTRRWFYEPELSSGSLDDEIYHLNVPLIASSDFVIKKDEKSKQFYYFSINMMQSKSNSVLFPKHKIRQLMFEGYTDTLIQEASKLQGMNVPFDHFGWFYKRNDSSSDGRFTIQTGFESLSQLGQLHSWNNSTQLNHFHGNCNSLAGVSSELQPPFQEQRPQSINIFVGDICRPLKLVFKKIVTSKNVQLDRYVLDMTSFDYSKEENTCFCLSDGCPVNGIADTSKCTYDSPTGISQPHFLGGDLSLLEGVDGLNPNPENHSFYMDIHPMLGIASKVNVGIQINVRIRIDKQVDFLKNMTRDDFWFPVLWFSAEAEMTDDMAFQLMILDNLDLYITTTGALVATSGILLLLGTLTCFRTELTRKFVDRYNRKNRRPPEQVHPDTLLLKQLNKR